MLNVLPVHPWLHFRRMQWFANGNRERSNRGRKCSNAMRKGFECADAGVAQFTKKTFQRRIQNLERGHIGSANEFGHFGGQWTTKGQRFQSWRQRTRRRETLQCCFFHIVPRGQVDERRDTGVGEAHTLETRHDFLQQPPHLHVHNAATQHKMFQGYHVPHDGAKGTQLHSNERKASHCGHGQKQ